MADDPLGKMFHNSLPCPGSYPQERPENRDESDLVADLLRQAMRAEREACAQICEDAENDENYPDIVRAFANVLARRIRRRSLFPPKGEPEWPDDE